MPGSPRRRTSSCAISHPRPARSPPRGSRKQIAYPAPALPPSPRRTSPRNTSNTPPRSGLKVIALRIAIFRVRGVGVEKNASSHAFATSMEKFHVSGAPGSLPPSSPVRLVHGAIQRVPVDGRRAGVHPESGRVLEAGNHFVQQARAANARFEDRAPVRRRVPAIDAASGKIDADIAPLEFARSSRPAVRPSHRTAFHGAGRGMRLNTVTACPCAWKWRARMWPTCPLPPGITIFIEDTSATSRRLGDHLG